MKRPGNLIVAATLALSVVISPGCGRKQTTTVQSTSTTLGQELTDLQEAHDRGVISQKEYGDLKKQVMKKYR